MNHTAIATQALRYRLASLGVDVDDYPDQEIEQLARAAVCRADPSIDTAIRTLGTAWVRAGLAPDTITEPWEGPEVEALFAGDPGLVDAIDTLVTRLRSVSPVG